MATIHISRGASNLGAFPEDQVREGIRSGRFLSSDLGWKEGMENWQPLSQFAEFAGDIAAAPTGAPPPPPTAPPLAIAPVAGTGSSPTTEAGLPWDNRSSKGLVTAFIETLQMVLTKPGMAFTVMRREGGLGEPLLYMVIGGTVGLIFTYAYNFLFRSFAMFGTRQDTFRHLLSGVGLIFLLILTPLLVVIGTFIGSAIYHLCLMIVGGAKQSFETTFRVVCFAGGSVSPLLVIPFCGGLVVFVWKIVLYTIGFSRAHDTDTGRALVAALLPLIVCCGGGILLLALFGAGIGAWSSSQH